MKILFVSLTDPTDRRALSGTIFSIYDQLKKDHEVIWIGPFKNTFLRYCRLALIKLIYKVSGFNLPLGNSPWFARDYAAVKQQQVDVLDFDYVVAPMASALVANINFRNKPIVYISDAVFNSMIGYYINDFPVSLLNTFNKLEKKSLMKSDSIVVSSQWAYEEIVNFYKVDSEKVHVLPFGPNLMRAPSFQEIPADNASDTLKLLFVGVDWVRKGGDFVIEVYKLLGQRFHDCKLTIVGCDYANNDTNIEVYKHLDKNEANDADVLEHLYKSSHFLIQPSVAECYGMVFVEASSFGVPSLATRTGGIPSAVYENDNGFLFDLKSEPIIYADKIESLFRDKIAYSKLRSNARRCYEEKLNWEVWMRSFSKLLN